MLFCILCPSNLNEHCYTWSYCLFIYLLLIALSYVDLWSTYVWTFRLLCLIISWYDGIICIHVHRWMSPPYHSCLLMKKCHSLEENGLHMLYFSVHGQTWHYAAFLPINSSIKVGYCDKQLLQTILTYWQLHRSVIFLVYRSWVVNLGWLRHRKFQHFTEHIWL